MFEPVTARGLYKQTRQKLSADLHSTILLHTTSKIFERKSLAKAQQPIKCSFQFIASYVWYSVENLAGDLFLGSKFV